MSAEALDTATSSDDQEERYVRKQFVLLLYRLGRLGAAGGRLHDLFLQTLLEQHLSADVPRARPTLAAAVRASGMRVARLARIVRRQLHAGRSAAPASAEAPDAGTPDDQEERYVKKQFSLLLYRLGRLGRARPRLQGIFLQALLEERLSVETPRGPLAFAAVGKTAAGRMMSILTKQPETIAWIDGFEPGGVFWDVGANVGVYTLYAALRGDTRVVAFEPAAVNYFTLAANCELNEFEARVDCLLVGLGRGREIGRIEMSQFAPAMSFSFAGKRARPYRSRQAALILSMDALVEDYHLPVPNYVKIDVPGLTEAIIEGGERTLQRPELRAIHMELADRSSTGQRILQRLERAGFVAASRAVHGSQDVTFVRRPA